MDNKELSRKHLEKIKRIASEINREIKIMEICGGHTNIIMKYGIRDILPENVKLISGPGCPVCVSSQHDIDCMIELAHKGVPVATYGDMMKVPGTKYSLQDAHAQGGKVFEIYSATEVLELKNKYPDIVFFGIGFETTAPMTAFLLQNNVCVYSVHKLVPPALEILAKDDKINIDGFLSPGHVTTIIGLDPYRKIKTPQVISGFTPEMILRALSILIELIYENRPVVINGYPEVVKDKGNQKAMMLLDKYFKIEDSEWRGLGVLPMSGLEVREDSLNAKIKFKDIIEKVEYVKKDTCETCNIEGVCEDVKSRARCGEILLGIIEPGECPLYGKECTPDNPIGACMVSEEGSCSIAFRYGK
ncbi:hydrogenase formation protein HypD [Candidatus Woesearchaeota archaeon]|nr:hydrogenase formation protein HypD [Candidatus Woesearchaeota archaeon]